MADLPEGIDSNFRYILIAAKRAEQLIDGARSRRSSRHVKPTTMALDELNAGVVPWRRVTPEEYDLLRHQELVSREKDELTPIITVPLPVLPVVVEEEVDVEEEEFEEDLEDAEFDEDLGEVDEPTEPGPEDLVPEALPEALPE
jgi:DNA-directed RNA polymerase subunit K/omega